MTMDEPDRRIVEPTHNAGKAARLRLDEAEVLYSIRFLKKTGLRFARPGAS